MSRLQSPRQLLARLGADPDRRRGPLRLGGGSWDLGDAVGDAGHILAVAAGVTLIGLAVLAPIALIALLAWLGGRAWVRFGRRRALG